MKAVALFLFFETFFYSFRIILKNNIIFVQTKTKSTMKTIEKVNLEKVQRTYTMGFNYTSTVNEFSRIVYFTDGSKFSVMSLLSEIGNNGLDSWNNVEKMKRSTSNNNIKKYLSQFVNNLEILN